MRHAEGPGPRLTSAQHLELQRLITAGETHPAPAAAVGCATKAVQQLKMTQLPGLSDAFFGQAVHEAARDVVRASPALNFLLRYQRVGVDFVGRGVLGGIRIEVGTAAGFVGKFQKYGQWLEVVTYTRP